MARLLALAWSLAYLARAVLALTGNQIVADLQTFLSPGSGIYLPSDDDYANATIPQWNLHDAAQYAVAVKPASAEDVQKIVSFH